LAVAQRLAPEAGATHIAAGYFAYSCQSDYPSALRSFQAALLTNPNDGTVHFTMGLVLRRLGHPVEAAGALEKSVALDPLQSEHFGNLVRSLMTLRRFAEVVAHVERRSRMKSFDLAERWTWTRARFELDGDRTQLVERVRKLSEAGGPAKIGLLIAAEMAAGNFAEALRLQSDRQFEANASSSLRLTSLVRRAELAHVLGRADEVAALANQAQSLMGAARGARFGESGVAQAELMLAAMQGRRSDALIAMRRLQEVSADDHFSQIFHTFRIGTAHLLLGDEAAALESLQRQMTGPCSDTEGPRTIRLHPVWSRLNGNPRFEEILKNAKPL
jgi:tetratricopeptide (TPR) repeat protein